MSVLTRVVHQGTLRASSTLHDQLYHKILRCPMKLLDLMPTARILSRFSKDMDEGMSMSVWVCHVLLTSSVPVCPCSGCPSAVPG